MNPIFNSDQDNLIHNTEFFEWVVRPTPELEQYWNQYLSENPASKNEIEEAAFLLRSITLKEKEDTGDEMQQLWNRIEARTSDKKRNVFRLSYWIAAASILVVLGLSGVIYFHIAPTKNAPINYLAIAKVEPKNKEVKLIFSDQSEEVINSKNIEIKYDKNGEIEVNSENQLTHKFTESKSDEQQLNQLVVPSGRRTSLTLSDGTKLWLNSGSRTIFPVVFKKETREIFIEGEAYLEVAHDQSRPFIVVTNKIQVKVLGTKFNISAYPDDMSNSVVLVEGRVQALVNSKKVIMKPNQLLTFEKNTGTTALNETDVLPFISWKDGWMYCDKEKLESISTRLSKFYNVKIEFGDQQASELTLTGKLDLKTECVDIFNAISSIAPITYEIRNDVIVIFYRKVN